MFSIQFWKLLKNAEVMKRWIALLGLCLALEARQIETFYGALEIDEPVLLDLIDSPALQRLQFIHQYGVAYYTTHREEYTRYDHSLGVFALLRLKGFSLTEQIAGLLHDVSHTVFSHVGDWILGKEHQEKAYQDAIHLSYLKKSGIEKILQKYGLTCEELLPELFPALECHRPNLCADRIDYNIQGAYFQGFLTYEEALTLFHDLQFKEGVWVAHQLELMKKLTRFPLFMTLSCWSSPTNHLASRALADAILRAIELHLLSYDEIHFGTDDAVWNLLSNATDPFIKTQMHRIENTEAYYQLVERAKADLIIQGKFHGFDPWIQKGEERIRLTALDQELEEEYQRVKQQIAQGWAIQINFL